MHTDSGMTGISLSGYMPYMTVASLEMSDEPKECHIEEKSLIPIIDGLFAERLIFHNRDYSEIVSVVDISTSK